MTLYEYKPFHKQLTRLARQGGVAQLAYDQVRAAINNWRHRLPVTISQTRNGESRIPHAVKYHLSGAYRLITVEHGSARILLFVGSHDDAEHWLNRHRGAQFVVGADGGVAFVPLETVPPDIEGIQNTPTDAPRMTGPVLGQLPTGTLDLLGLSRGIALTLNHLATFEGLAENDELWEAIHEQPFSSDEQRNATIHAIDNLRHGRLLQAIKCIEVFAEQATSSPDALQKALEAGTGSDTIANLSALSDDDFDHRFHNSSYAEWLLFLHPEQQRHVAAVHSGPTRLLGVSGSGKTCVLVHRAVTLARRYPRERVLVLVLNESLKHLLTNLLKELCPEEQRQRIDVLRIYDYCHKVVKTLTPNAAINPIDPISGEDLSTCWSDFTHRPHARQESRRVRASIAAMQVDPWGYLHDELIWIRTGIGGSQQQRKEYFTVERRGRSLPFPLIADPNLTYDRTRTTTGFDIDTRACVLRLLADYEEYMREGGLLDEDGVALSAFELRHQIPEHPALRYRCVLVDEVQDCSTTQLGVIAKIPSAETDGLLLVGDPVQKVFPRQQHFRNAGIDIRGRAIRLNTNYRNTREILDAAYSIISAFRDRSPVPDDEVLRPELACRSGPRPTLVECENADEQWRCVRVLLKHIQRTDSGSVCVGSPDPSIRITRRRHGGHMTFANPRVDIRLLQLCQQMGWRVLGIDGQASLNRLADSVAGAKFEDMKGFEFRNVLLVDLNHDRLASPSIPADEHWRVAFQLYVAMTRAQERLWMFSVGPPSPLLKHLEGFVDRMTGRELRGLPPRADVAPIEEAGESYEGLEYEHTTEQDGAEQVSAEQDGAEQVGAEQHVADQRGAEQDAEDSLALLFPEEAPTSDLLRLANANRANYANLDKVMAVLSKRDFSAFAEQFEELRAHWLSVLRERRYRDLVESGEVEWPEHAAMRSSDALCGILFPTKQGMLSFMGYQVGMNSPLTPKQRRDILIYVYLGRLPRVCSDAYTAEWGEPRSPTRLAKLRRTLEGFIRNASLRGGNMDIAVQEWRDDLEFVEDAFGKR